LCVGTVEAKKNHALLYYTYKLAQIRGIDLPKIVIVGRKGWNTENIVDIMSRDPEVKDKFVITESIDDEELSWLFDNCMCTILPSFHEGWGIPIAESVARGIPCICSNTSSMVEIAEEYVTHFSPASSDECLAAIQDILEPGVLEKRKRDIKKYRPTSWDDTYRQVDTYIKEIL
jgi:glycosyltransferase involved in cell wall biosynthesis